MLQQHGLQQTGCNSTELADSDQDEEDDDDEDFLDFSLADLLLSVAAVLTAILGLINLIRHQAATAHEDPGFRDEIPLRRRRVSFAGVAVPLGSPTGSGRHAPSAPPPRDSPSPPSSFEATPRPSRPDRFAVAAKKSE